MKNLILTAEVLEEVQCLRRAMWDHFNGHPVTKENVGRAAHFLSEIEHYERFGDESRCMSGLYHGPGHQSRCGCELKPGHEGNHVGRLGQQLVEWSTFVASTDYFDQLPDID